MGRKVPAQAAAAVMTMLLGLRCGGPSKEGGQGTECFRAEECAAGLVCIEQRCTSDLTSVNIRPEGGMGQPEAGANTVR
jgi:hypothetical protein